MSEEPRHGSSDPLGAPVRYRVLGETQWRTGEAVGVDHSELTFLGDAPLEVHSAVEILLTTWVRLSSGQSPLTFLCLGRVVRRWLANWPDLRSVLVVTIASCQIASQGEEAEATAA